MHASETAHHCWHMQCSLTVCHSSYYLACMTQKLMHITYFNQGHDRQALQQKLVMLISARVASDILPSTILERSVLVYLQLLQRMLY